ncbi:MAG: molybdopterin-guanine dinucleotide biosynthesis protein B [Pseudomonadota bacterium]
MKIYGVVGWKNSGKTTLMERLVAEVARRGFTVSTIKHAHHVFDVDQPGKDSHRHREAGASEVLISSRKRFALMHEVREGPEPEVDDLVARLAPVDLVLIEGYKRGRHPKVEAHRAATGQGLIAAEDDTIRLVASNDPVSVAQPVIALDDHGAIVDFILKDTGLA